MRWMRVLAAAHRYLGAALCLVLFTWFSSGIVMMYSGYPVLSEAEKLAGTEPLDWAGARLLPGEAYHRAGLTHTVEHVRLAMLRGRPAYFFYVAEQGWKAVYADDGRASTGIDVDGAEGIARRFHRADAALNYLGLFESPDQWTIYTAWAPYLPSHGFSSFYKFEIPDAAGTQVSVARATGDVIQRTTRSSRFWGYLGAVVHWIYPTSLRTRHEGLWNDLIVWLSGAGSVLCLVGLIIGTYYLRWPRGRSKWRVSTPYSDNWMAWHHYIGLIFGFFAFTWVFSGLLSMDPWSWSQTDDYPSNVHQTVMRGGPLDLSAFSTDAARAREICGVRLQVKEMRLTQLQRKPYYLCVETPHRTALVAADEAAPVLLKTFPAETLVTAARGIMPDVPLSEATMLSSYDAYYYPGWTDKSVNNATKRLPVLRLVFADSERSLIYIDPSSGAPVLAYGSSARMYRWLFHGLHSLDLPGLYLSRPWWDVVVLPLMVGGAALSFTGIWIAVTWLKKTRTQRRRVNPTPSI